MVVAIGLRVKQYILLFAVLSFVYFMKRGFLLPRRNTKSSIATKHAPSSVEASARDLHFHDITCVFSLTASTVAILNHQKNKLFGVHAQVSLYPRASNAFSGGL